MSIESVMLSNYLSLCCPLLLLSTFPSIRVFSSESALCIRWPKYGSFSISPSNACVQRVQRNSCPPGMPLQWTKKAVNQQINSFRSWKVLRRQQRECVIKSSCGQEWGIAGNASESWWWSDVLNIYRKRVWTKQRAQPMPRARHRNEFGLLKKWKSLFFLLQLITIYRM